VLVLVEYRPDARLLGLLPIVRSDRGVCAALRPNSSSASCRVIPKAGAVIRQAQRRTGIHCDEIISVLKVAVFEAEDLPPLRFRP
jgi:hypothetical protein